MEMIFDVAIWMNSVVEQMGVWALSPFVVGAGLIGLKIKQSP